MTEDTNATANREKTLFVSFPAAEPWTQDELTNLVDSIDSVTPEDVGIMLAPDDIEYLDREQVEEYIDALQRSLEG